MSTPNQSITVSSEELLVLRGYAAGDEISAIAARTGQDREAVASTLRVLCGLNRGRANNLVTECEQGRVPVAPPPARTAAPPPAAAPERPPTSFEAMMARADASSSARIRALAQKVRTLVDELAARLAESAGREAAEREIADLEAKLAAARAKLRAPAAGSTATPARTVAARVKASPSRAIRQWAVDNHMPCPTLGRVPRHVVDAYEQAHAGGGGDG